MTTTKYRLRLSQRVASTLNGILSSRGTSVDWYNNIDPAGAIIKKRFNESRDDVILMVKKNADDVLSAFSTLTDDQKTLIIATNSDSTNSLLTKDIKDAKAMGVYFGVDSVIIVSLNNKPPSKDNMKLFYNTDQRPMLEYFTYDELLIDPLRSIYNGYASIDRTFFERYPELLKRDSLGRPMSNELYQMKSTDSLARFLGAFKGDVIRVEHRVILPGFEHSKELIFYIVR